MFKKIFIIFFLTISFSFAITDTILSQKGKYSITWGFEDQVGNVKTILQIVYIRDTVAPVPSEDELDTLFGECFVSVVDTPTAVDNFNNTIIKGKTNDTLFFNEQGTHKIVWYYDDGVNKSFQDQIVVVKDVTPPYIDSLPTIYSDSVYKLIYPVAIDNCDDSIYANIIRIFLDTTGN